MFFDRVAEWGAGPLLMRERFNIVASQSLASFNSEQPLCVVKKLLGAGENVRETDGRRSNRDWFPSASNECFGRNHALGRA
jgi:hypothetical protein